MVTPGHRTKFEKRSRLKSRVVVASIVIFGLAIVVTGIVVVSLFFVDKKVDDVNSQVGSNDIKYSWNVHDYRKVIEQANVILSNDQFDFQALLYRGFSYFYHGLSQPDFEEKAILLGKATIDLRKALVFEPFRNNGDIFYILGKAYFHRGYFFQDLSREYLLKAIQSGYRASDLNEYLGLVSSDLGDTKSAIEYFKKAIGEDPRDIVLLSLASAYVAIDDLQTAMSYVDRIISNSKDMVIVQKARFVRGDLLSRLGKTDEAIAEYESILRDNPSSADAHFFLGEVYATKGDTVKARAEWREAYNIDPKHGGAVSRLNS